MLSLKNNIAIDRSGLAFTLQSSLTVTGTAVIAWERDAVNVSADDALAPRDGRRDRASPVLDEAVEWLRTQLSGGPKPAKELQVAADADGIKSDAVRRAKRALGVAASRDGGFGAAGAWVWTLPSEGGDGDDAPDDDAPDGDVLDGDGAPLRPQVRLRRVRRPPF
jgi:hypothetical protein